MNLNSSQLIEVPVIATPYDLRYASRLSLTIPERALEMYAEHTNGIYNALNTAEFQDPIHEANIMALRFVISKLVGVEGITESIEFDNISQTYIVKTKNVIQQINTYRIPFSIFSDQNNVVFRDIVVEDNQSIAVKEEEGITITGVVQAYSEDLREIVNQGQTILQGFIAWILKSNTSRWKEEWIDISAQTGIAVVARMINKDAILNYKIGCRSGYLAEKYFEAKASES